MVSGSYTRLRKVRLHLKEQIVQNVDTVFSWPSTKIGSHVEDVVTQSLKLKFPYYFFNA